MRRRKDNPETRVSKPAPHRAATPNTGDGVLVPAPKLRRQLGISPTTLWRWRRSQTAQFPPAKTINGRLYFSTSQVMAWLARQPDALLPERPEAI